MGLTIAQGLIFISYITFLLIKFGKPLPSISDSWYQLPKNYKPLFTLFCWSLGFTMLFQTDGTTPAFFFSGAGLCFVGAATMFKSDKTTALVHSIGAIVCIVSALIGLWVERDMFLPIFLFGASASILSLKSIKLTNKTWWIEIIAFVFILIGLLF